MRINWKNKQVTANLRIILLCFQNAVASKPEIYTYLGLKKSHAHVYIFISSPQTESSPQRIIVWEVQTSFSILQYYPTKPNVRRLFLKQTEMHVIATVFIPHIVHKHVPAKGCSST